MLLQKEQSLVTDDWPWSVQYRSATGYGCPDTAPCDAQYYGFTNQVNKAAWQFRRLPQTLVAIATNHSRNYIQYNPNTACGVQMFMLKTMLRLAYITTHHISQTISPANLYGIEILVEPYGNRNFGGYLVTGLAILNKVTTNVIQNLQVLNVWSLTNSAGGQLLTVSSTERDNAINKYHWRYEGIAFYASSTQKTATIPVYRIARGGRYYFHRQYGRA